MGEGESVTTESLARIILARDRESNGGRGLVESHPFHIMKAVDRIRPGSVACQYRDPAGQRCS